jgi:hypothetical protein
MSFSAEKEGNASLNISDGRERVCEIRDLRLQNVRCRKGGRLLIGEEVPLPLYWEQYANHEHPERNSGSHGAVQIMEEGADRIVMECAGATRSGSVLSDYVVTIGRGTEPESYVFDLRAEFRVADDATWVVTHNPHHGELEFCNFWPDGAFVTDIRKSLRYEGCYVVRSNTIHAVPHHHLESPDKHNIRMQPGDRMVWLLEDENPCIELLSGGDVTAGVCAYMWDAHLAYRVCNGKEPSRTLLAGARYTASFRMTSLGREEGMRIAAAATQLTMEAEDTPVIVEGVHTFSETFSNTNLRPDVAWPWETEVVSGNTHGVQFLLDREMGWDDSASLRLDSLHEACAQWKATALGPAFRQPPFEKGARYRLVAYVRCRLVTGNASIAIRLHREGEEGLFNPETYEIFRSPLNVSGQSEWTRLDVITPPVNPVPDRVHLLLELNGAGSCWFDNVHFTREL